MRCALGWSGIPSSKERKDTRTLEAIPSPSPSSQRPTDFRFKVQSFPLLSPSVILKVWSKYINSISPSNSPIHIRLLKPHSTKNKDTFLHYLPVVPYRFAYQTQLVVQQRAPSYIMESSNANLSCMYDVYNFNYIRLIRISFNNMKF